MRVGRAGTEDRSRSGVSQARGVWQRLRGARAVNLPVEGENRVGKGVSARPEDYTEAICSRRARGPSLAHA